MSEKSLDWSFWKPMDLDEMVAEQKRLYDLPANSPDHPSMINWDNGFGCIDVFWGGYEYNIPLNDIKEPVDLFEWIVHLSEKGWTHTTPQRISLFIKKVFAAKGWDVYNPPKSAGEAPKASSKARERQKMTSTLRYQTIKRDGYRCRACGGSVATGSTLHVDHIIPISKGGKTESKNLQTLCACCNQGKRDQ